MLQGLRHQLEGVAIFCGERRGQSTYNVAPATPSTSTTCTGCILPFTGRAALLPNRKSGPRWVAVASEMRIAVCNSFVSPSMRLRSEEHTSELQSRQYLVCRLLLEKKKLTT